ncbi:MAG TPA: hypothetical protein VKT73_15160 [Xanthobacteraceae bacterium]|nr:hypothetical protein [Xanthobacteraceae bacterium]
MKAERKNLILASAELARAAPESWNKFLVAFVEHVDDLKNQCVDAPPDAVHVAQGMAKEGNELARLFGDAVKSADRIGDRR